jgi:hypothetical protein
MLATRSLLDETRLVKIALVTDAWQPQVNGVVTTLVELVRELQALGHCVEVIHPGLFKTRPCPGYAGIDLAVAPKRVLTEKLDAFAPDAIHIATEGEGLVLPLRFTPSSQKYYMRL